jgi:hypothetical protein
MAGVGQAEVFGGATAAAATVRALFARDDRAVDEGGIEVAPDPGCRKAQAGGELSDRRRAVLEQGALDPIAGATLGSVQPGLDGGTRGFHNVIIA